MSHPICGWGWVLVRFWQDIWCGDTLLILSYPELFVVSRSKETCVADLRRFSNGVLFWDLNFVRAIQDWELESLSNFLDSIYGVSLRGVGTIRIIGILIKEEVLQFTHITRFWQTVSISPSYGRLFGSPRSLLELLFFFVWTIVLGNILTIDNLWKQRILILGWCCICKRNGESADHLLIHCPLASDLANLWCLPCFGLSE